NLARAVTRVSAIICPDDGSEADHALRLKPDHIIGAGHLSWALMRRFIEVRVEIVTSVAHGLDCKEVWYSQSSA
ncbi:hypothetical protein NJB95_22835, partial [Brucella intermedia]|uniref:hypothetical protein n=1 Tax=Brucella intermedia TaxID=94625 RepID=UPI00209BA048